MVCSPHEDVPAKLVICDQIEKKKQNWDGVVDSCMTIDSIFNALSERFLYDVGEIKLTLTERNGSSFVLNEHKGKTLRDIGVYCTSGEMYVIRINKLATADCPQQIGYDFEEDDLELGASCSPTQDGESTSLPPLAIDHSDEDKPYVPNYPVPSKYVGLVNQAMTCYLNSLLQALFMTPEFRNAMYQWEYNGASPARSVPFQLQKLFVNLQTSPKNAVETTELTKSFGWNSSEAWQQHDIQELCRALFDALEQTFKHTSQENLINDLYEGKMLDYVKCLECGTDNSREDTFLDIPLSIRPFGSTIGYGSVEEAMRAFVQPETLDGNNQYLCEKCGKKCDAHKGLKFTKFPYLLTLHLKRFDFDYSTMSRIKLNDKVVFPQILNLNSFIINTGEDKDVLSNHTSERDKDLKSEDCSTADSVSAEEENFQDADDTLNVNNSHHNNNANETTTTDCAEDDEGIDVNSVNNHSDNNCETGPYTYELFSIMVHSGSASGGHYYAYIKDFDTNLWYCFNDQSVTSITEDHIEKSYGEGSKRGYYSGAYSSSTNAYMLMYRKLDMQRNCKAMTVDQFPVHIKKLLEDMRRKEHEDTINKERPCDIKRLRIFYRQTTGKLDKRKVILYPDETVQDVKVRACLLYKLNEIVKPEDVRLVLYDSVRNCIERSIDDESSMRIDDGNEHNPSLAYRDWLLDTKRPNERWKKYNPGATITVIPVNLHSNDIYEPCVVRVEFGQSYEQIVESLADGLMLPQTRVQHIFLEESPFQPLMEIQLGAGLEMDLSYLNQRLWVVLGGGCLTNNSVSYSSYNNNNNSNNNNKVNNSVSDNNICANRKCCSASDSDGMKLHMAEMRKRMEDLVYFQVKLPDTSIEILEMHSMPYLDPTHHLELFDPQRTEESYPKSQLTLIDNTAAPLDMSRLSASESNNQYETSDLGQSASEDSSLSDSDKTLIGDGPDVDYVDVLQANLNPALEEDMELDYDDNHHSPTLDNFENYFKVTSISNSDLAFGGGNGKSLRVLASKRLTLNCLKKRLEPIMNVPKDYFKLYRLDDSDLETEWRRTNDDLSKVKCDEKLIVKLGRVLKDGEHLMKLFLLEPDYTQTNNLLFEYVIAEGDCVENVKREVLNQAKKQHKLDIPFNKCRLREKSYKKPRTVYLDDQKFADDIVFTYNMEMYLQLLPDVETVTSKNQRVLFIRNWSPSTMAVGKVDEIVLETDAIDELRQKISTLSTIPLEYVDIAHSREQFPSDGLRLSEIHSSLPWNMKGIESIRQKPMDADDGSLFFYKDSREVLKTLTAEESAELEAKENQRLGRPCVKTTYVSPGKERALKIYLDTSGAAACSSTCNNELED